MEERETSMSVFPAAYSLWGKQDSTQGQRWLPLCMHLYDSALVADRIWESWVPEGTKRIVAGSLDGNLSLAKKAFTFLAGLHDIGKATPAFQSMPWRCGDGNIENFDWKLRCIGLEIPLIDSRLAPKHPIAGQALFEIYFENEGFNRDNVRSFASIIGGHHGMPPEKRAINSAKGKECSKYLGRDDLRWQQAQHDLAASTLDLIAIDNDDVSLLLSHFISPQVACILTGLVIMTDWVASNQNIFPLFKVEERVFEEDFLTNNGKICVDPLRKRLESAWRELGLLPCWQESIDVLPNRSSFYEERFVLPNGAKPRPVQRAALDIAISADDPGMMIIEAPMGEGKTEAALAAAEVLACRTDRGGVCIALPTMATTDAMFGRVHAWLKNLPQSDRGEAKGIYLAHGKAQLNEEFQGISRCPNGVFSSIGQDLSEEHVLEDVVVSDWMYGRKKGVLANFLVCTVDQVLMGALEMKHLALRQLALANKVVIIDECHAYDTYMQEYLCRVLEWLGSWNTPVVLLSATLPTRQRQKMVDAYLKGKRATSSKHANDALSIPLRKKADAETGSASPEEKDAEVVSKRDYPLITYTSGQSTKERPVKASARGLRVTLRQVDDDDNTLVNLLTGKLIQGGCAAIICDTVVRSQHVYHLLSDVFGDEKVLLTHSRFIDLDRMANEHTIRQLFGPDATTVNGRRPAMRIVVGTQVLEQSLDVDFDLLVTDIAPIDLLLQRIGRVHRHERGRGESDRPAALRKAMCYVRGIEEWGADGPTYSRDIPRVYEEASLLESMAGIGLLHNGESVDIRLPDDISPLVQVAYGAAAKDMVPDTWSDRYQMACVARKKTMETQAAQAQAWLLPPISCLHGESLVGLFKSPINSGGQRNRDEDAGQRAVRDTQETVEVMALRLVDGEVRLLPWIGDPSGGVERGSVVRTDIVPSDQMARIAAQSTVRLPISLCNPSRMDALIDEIEKMDGQWVGAWQESYWLAGRLALLFEEDESGELSVTLDGWKLTYTEREGLVTEKSIL